MIAKKLFVLSFFALTICGVYGQSNGEFTPSGKAFATIYANFHHGFSEEVSEETAFELTRAYLGYEYQLSPEFFAKVKLDIGSPEDGAEGSSLKRYAYFKNAYVQYQKNRWKFKFGLFDLEHFKPQQKFWGKRYIYKSFNDAYGFGSCADIGVSAYYSINKQLNIDAAIVNGEGYKKLQSDNIYKYGLGVTYKPLSKLTIRVYSDCTSDTVTQMTFAGFIGYKHDRFNLAAEYNYMTNNAFNDDHHKFGYSFYGTYKLKKDIELFARYDKLESNKPEGEERPWNLAKDGSTVIAGVQYQPIKQLKVSVNYQDWYPWAVGNDNIAYLFLNVEVTF